MANGLIAAAAGVVGMVAMLFVMALSDEVIRDRLKVEWLALWAGVQSVTWARRDVYEARHRVASGAKSCGRKLA